MSGTVEPAGREATRTCPNCGVEWGPGEWHPDPCRARPAGRKTTPSLAEEIAAADVMSDDVGPSKPGRKATPEVDGYCVCDTRLDGGEAPDCGVRDHREKARAARAASGRKASTSTGGDMSGSRHASGRQQTRCWWFWHRWIERAYGRKCQRCGRIVIEVQA